MFDNELTEEEYNKFPKKEEPSIITKKQVDELLLPDTNQTNQEDMPKDVLFPDSKPPHASHCPRCGKNSEREELEQRENEPLRFRCLECNMSSLDSEWIE
jgi:hypothetical protein